MSELVENLTEVLERMRAACGRVKRSAADVELIAVSKTFGVDAIHEAFVAGQTVFGESRLQEAEPKINGLPNTLVWHFIGRVQRNKVRKILALFSVIHAVDSLRLAAYIDGIAGETGVVPQIFLQVNVGGEASKGGFEPSELRAAMPELLKLKQLKILGLMCIPPAGPDAEASRPWFVMLRDLRDDLEGEFSTAFPFLSMGMSGDYEVAVEEGATHVRVGSAIFGKRANRVDGELG